MSFTAVLSRTLAHKQVQHEKENVYIFFSGFCILIYFNKYRKKAGTPVLRIWIRIILPDPDQYLKAHISGIDLRCVSKTK